MKFSGVQQLHWHEEQANPRVAWTRIFRSWFNVLVLACGLAACGGVMQVMPTSAANLPIEISDVAKLEPNINAGIKLLKYIRDDYFRAYHPGGHRTQGPHV